MPNAVQGLIEACDPISSHSTSRHYAYNPVKKDANKIMFPLLFQLPKSNVNLIVESEGDSVSTDSRDLAVIVSFSESVGVNTVTFSNEVNLPRF